MSWPLEKTQLADELQTELSPKETVKRTNMFGPKPVRRQTPSLEGFFPPKPEPRERIDVDFGQKDFNRVRENVVNKIGELVGIVKHPEVGRVVEQFQRRVKEKKDFDELRKYLSGDNVKSIMSPEHYAEMMKYLPSAGSEEPIPETSSIHDFSEISIKPTEISTEWTKDIDESLASVVPLQSSEDVPKIPQYYTISKSLQTILAAKKKSRVLLELRGAHSDDDVEAILKQSQEKGLLSDDEFQVAVSAISSEKSPSFSTIDEKIDSKKSKPEIEQKVIDESAPQPVKVSRVIPIKPFKMEGIVDPNSRVGLDSEKQSIHEVLEENYVPNQTPFAEKIVSEIGIDNDKTFSAESKKAYTEGRIGDALVYIAKIQNMTQQSEVIGDLVEECVKVGDFPTARNFLSRIIDKQGYGAQLGQWLEAQTIAVFPKIKIRKDVGDVSFVKPEPESPHTVDAVVDDSLVGVDDFQHSPRPEEIKDEDLVLRQEELVAPETIVPVEVPQEVVASVTKEEKIEVSDPELEWAKKIREQTDKVKALEHTNEKAYAEELALLRSLEQQRDSFRAPKTAPEDVAVVSAAPEAKKEFISERTQAEQKLHYEKLQADLEKARNEYAQQYVDWEYRKRNSTKMFAKTMMALGVTKPTPEKFSIKTPAVLEAFEEYTKAKMNAGEGGIKDNQIIFLSERVTLDNKMQELREQKELLDAQLSETDKKQSSIDVKKQIAGTLKKAFGTWDHISTKQKVLISAALFAGGQALGTVGDSMKTDGYEGFRVPRGTLSDVNLTPPTGHIDLSSIIPDLTKDEVGALPEVSKPTGMLPVMEELPKIKIPEAIVPVEVPLSNKGFIDTLKHLQEGIVRAYGSVEAVPEEIQRTVVQRPDVELAKQFGFYKPETGESAVGYAGEKIILNDQGEVVYQRVNGEKQIIFDTKTGLTQKFVGGTQSGAPLFEAKATVPSETSASQTPPIEEKETQKIPATSVVVKEDLKLTDEVAPGPKDKPLETPAFLKGQSFEIFEPKNISALDRMSEPEFTEYMFKNHIKYNDLGGFREVYLKNDDSESELKIGHEEVVDMDGSHTFMLEDQFQESPTHHWIRNIFTRAFNDYTKDKNLLVTHFEPFEGGQIAITEEEKNGSKEVKVFLNGKEIAASVKGSQGTKIKINERLKGKWYLSDSVYDRAFKVAKKVLKSSSKKK